MMKTRILSIVALLLMAVTGAWAQGSGGDNWGPVQTSSAAWTALTEGSTTGMTLGAADATTYYYMTENLTFSNNTAGGSGLTIQGTVYIYIPSGVTLTATGADGEGTTGGGAGILVPSGTTLNIFGEGTIVATGGKAANGGNGGNGTAASVEGTQYLAGLGGAGGNGGGGAGAGIGTAGGNGGNGAAQLAEADASRPKANTEEWNGELSGLIGTNGTDGATAAAVGTVNIASSIDKTQIAGGTKGVGGAAGFHGGYICYGDEDVYSFSAGGDSQIDVPALDTSTLKAVAGGGGGGGGAGGGSAQAIGTGGAGGGGGASGACGSGRAEEGWLNDYWESVGAGGGAGGIGTEGNDGAKGYTCYFQCEYDAEFDEDDNHKPGGVGGSAGAASATKTAGTAAAPTYTTYFKTEGATLSKTSETYTFGSDTEISLPTITSTDGKNYKWMLSKYGRAFGETTSHCAGPNGDIYDPGTEVNLSNIYGDLEFTTVYIGCQIDCGSSSDRWWEETWAYLSGGKYAVVNLKNRKLYKDGYWNTLTLPFALSSEKLATTCLAGADIRRFESASWDGENQKLTINFSESGKIDAGVPYIIRWGTPETATGEVIENPSFTNVEVTITSQEEGIDDEDYGTETTSNGLRFEAQIVPVQLTSGSNALVFGNKNKLYKPKDELYVYATRAYFSYSGSISMARQIVMDFGDGDQQTTYIDAIDPATKYNLTKADGSEAHGTVAFTVGGAAATQAKKDDVVTVSVTPNAGYSAKDVTVRAYTSWEAASEILTGGGDNPGLVSDITVTKNETDGTWSFTMPEANVWVEVTYTKNLQDAWIQAITDQTYTGEAITPTVTVKDGETTLVLNTDYTVAYSNNTNVGTGTVTVTGTGNYSGTATANFTIVADKSALNTAITEAETYYNSIKDDHAEAAAALKTAIDTAKGMQEKGDATQEEVNNALSAFNTAKTTAEQTVLTETKDELNDDITEAEAYYSSIKDSNPTAAATLLDAINAAKQVKDNANATQEQVDAAIAALASAKTTAEQTVLTETKSALNTAITEAEAYYNSIKDSNPTAAATLLEVINTAKAAKDNGDATQEQVDAAIAALASAKTTAEQTVLTDTKTALNDDITEAEAYYNSIKDSNPTAAATLLEAINAAKAVKDNADATQEQVDAAIAALTGAKTTAEQTVLTETKTALNDDITEAEAYYNSIKDSNPEAAATLLAAINAAKAAKDNGEATQADVEAAIAALSTASSTAKVEVSRITLTIPAKSYMARIDADKRQIETAVAGVKLYSVKSVTNTEVELTAELSVIAAEMPYFIYNDNDTEVEVSIIVSSSDPDNVEYDSEHFKGTLVDKTFTDEDMQAADHYVLSGGSSFVWVKDAGTLSAGKCWIELIPTSAAHARRLSIVHEGETTGISTVKTTVDTKDAAVYDLQGRRVMQPTKGLFIVNGKKVVIK